MDIRSRDINREKPIFIVGTKRGGTTLLKRIINGHSSITIPPPGWFYHFIYPHLYSYGDLVLERNILELISDFLAIPIVKKYWDITHSPQDILQMLPERSFRGILFTFFQIYVSRYGTPLWGSKTPGNVFWLKEIQQDFPGVRFLMLYRDGRDVTIDQVETDWGPNNLYGASLWWDSYTQAILRSREGLEKGSFKEVFYEELVKDPEKVVGEICEFLQVDFESSMLRYYEADKDKFWKQAYHQKTSKPITPEYVGMYKNLPIRDRQLQIAVMGKTLAQLGYQLEDEPREIDFWERERLLEEDRHGGLITEGAVEFKNGLKHKRIEKQKKKRWTPSD